MLDKQKFKLLILLIGIYLPFTLSLTVSNKIDKIRNNTTSSKVFRRENNNNDEPNNNDKSSSITNCYSNFYYSICSNGMNITEFKNLKKECCKDDIKKGILNVADKVCSLEVYNEKENPVKIKFESKSELENFQAECKSMKVANASILYTTDESPTEYTEYNNITYSDITTDLFPITINSISSVKDEITTTIRENEIYVITTEASVPTESITTKNEYEITTLIESETETTLPPTVLVREETTNEPITNEITPTTKYKEPTTITTETSVPTESITTKNEYEITTLIKSETETTLPPTVLVREETTNEPITNEITPTTEYKEPTTITTTTTTTIYIPSLTDYCECIASEYCNALFDTSNFNEDFVKPNLHSGHWKKFNRECCSNKDNDNVVSYLCGADKKLDKNYNVVVLYTDIEEQYLLCSEDVLTYIIGEQSQWHELLIKSSSESPFLDIVGLSHFLTEWERLEV
ncbi:hypothetical protein BCR32DRAFT_286349 [Anaeromyces robustus]|uniref:Uncharacterized protein n=1 Tax=Anaeromyces robustus TaxID=1754192 RepID=A0A1Y1VY86_9FUNG|nr:hypothetical protein BCR32DRAFT_286349 [Anaeromyces robustus]|eukprot:ORX66231.1 hypothetical protein BCR32DRAFT_286349 [Anaeromyces robustus]